MSQTMKLDLKLPNLQGANKKNSRQSDRFRSQTQTGKEKQQSANANQSQEMSQKMSNLEGSKTLKSIGAPFKLPSDQEVFEYCKIEKDKRLQMKENKLRMRIWEKNTSNTQNPLPQFKNFEAQINDKHVTRTAYSQMNKRAISAALDIIKQRQKQKELGDTKKETVQDVLEQKKEMFLVTMTHGIISEEIKKLQTISQKKSEALQQSEQMLESDQKGFQDYLEQNKKLRIEAERKVDQVIKERKEKEMLIKQLNAELTSLRNERIKNEEVLQVYKEHKEFLEKLANKDFEQEKLEKIKNKIEQFKPEWINSQLATEEAQAKEKKLPFSRQQRQTQLEAKYHELVKQEEIQEIVDFDDNYPMHFKDSNQLVVYFDILEDKNLFLIQMKQNQEQQIDELKSQIAKEKTNINQKYKQLSDQRDQLKKQIDDVCNDISQLTMKSESNDLIIQEDQTDLKSKIHAIISEFQNEIQVHDMKSKTNLELLADIELFIEKTLKHFSNFNPKLVEMQRKKQDRIRKNQQREELNQLQKQEQEIKNQKNIEKMLQPSKKREGRQDMVRSEPYQKKVEKVDDTHNQDNEQDDQKYFQENFQFQI